MNSTYLELSDYGTTRRKFLEEELKQAREDRIFITHSNCDDATVQAVYDYLDSLQHFKEIFITSAGSVISSHCGPGTLGVLFVA